MTANSVRPPAAAGRSASQARITFPDVHQDHSLRGSLRVNDSQPTRSSHPRMLSAGGSLAGSLPNRPRRSACCRSQTCSRSSLARAPGRPAQRLQDPVRGGLPLGGVARDPQDEQWRLRRQVLSVRRSHRGQELAYEDFGSGIVREPVESTVR
ncbi:hypothetical protein SBI_09179 [Streptomyces bingchenggensis BCW-1]|uniref:Uncharacterized protein n=1 Tax=Streptomyces bingchenggensis (strain BCW-1) TaxID=749414 RepID=D7C3T1_STRBB|nr:hypothetical protein SBI_09179 [Streptomyces bingchenggensis BCW-1]